ncbi:MAG: acetate--CoA ligase family protein [Myxococcales bacterium]|nr:acetate--CoA ligase family protein [Myxococcales bacterium]MDH3844814.1 acetate--CoA ligase family protein [Myxococcales bacterium]
MRFYEFEAKQLLEKHGIPLVQSELVKTADEAKTAASKIGGPVILKAQVIAPGLTTASVQEVADPAGAKAAAATLLGLDDGGRKPNGILVEARPTGEAVYSLSFTYDGTTKLPVIAAANMAGKIDDLGDTHPERIVRRHFSALYPFSDYIAKELAKSLVLGGNDLKRMTRIVSGLARLFLKYDLADLDITSMVKLGEGRFAVLDVEADLEIEARHRQRPMLDDLGFAKDDLRQVREPTKFELEGARIDAEDPRGIISPIAEFDGNIGLVIGAGGGSLTLTDAVRKHGGRPANYAAIGGNPSVDKARRLTKLVLSKPGVDKIAVMSNVVSNTRADLVARGVIKGITELGFEPKDKILIFRVPGAWEADAAKILQKYGVEYCDRTVSISEAARRAVEKVS